MNDELRVFPQGFIFSTKPLTKMKYPHYSYYNVMGFHYYFDRYSEKCIAETDNHFIIIHGLFMLFDLDEGDLTDNAARRLLNLYVNDYDEFLNSLDNTAGRHVIIIGNKDEVRVYPDATAARSTYYSSHFGVISSHLNIIKELFNPKPHPLHGKGVNLTRYTEHTKFLNVKSIMPNFFFNLLADEKTRFWPRNVNSYKHMLEQDKLQLISDIWKLQMDVFMPRFDETVLSLSGGMDSRVSLAMSRDYLDDIKVFTYTPTTKNYTKIPKSFTAWAKSIYKDKIIVDKLLNIVKLNHNYIAKDNKTLSLTKEEIGILNRSSLTKHGRFLLPHYNALYSKNKTLHIRSNRLEIAKSPYINSETKNNIESVLKYLEQSMLNRLSEDTKLYKDSSSVINTQLEDMQYDLYEHDYHKLDLLYIETRLSRRMSELMNEADLAFETLLPFNNRIIIDIALSFPLSKRKEQYLLDELINHNYPILNFHGKNDNLNLYELDKKSSKISIFNSMNIFNAEDELIDFTETHDNYLYIPEKYLEQGFYTKTSTTFSRDKGVLKVNYIQKYYNNLAKNYFRFQIHINNNLVIDNELCRWSDEVSITIPDLVKGDIITFRIVSNKNLRGAAWSNASKVQFTAYQQSENIYNEPLENTCPL